MKNNLFRITIDTNPEDCNLHCVMCEEHSKYSNFKQKLFEKTHVKKRVMPLEWLEMIFQEAKQLDVQQIIPSTMGEPLLYEGIVEIYNLSKKYDIKINLTTNGTFPKKNILSWAEIIIPQTTDIKISINGANKLTSESIMQGINFDKQIKNINELVKYRNEYYHKTGYYCSITFQLTFMLNNMHEIADIVKLAADFDIDRIKGHHLWTHFKEIENLSFESNYFSKQKWNEIVNLAYQNIEKYRKPNGNKILLQNFYYLKTDIVSEKQTNLGDCPFLDKELWISSTGKISPCCAPDELRNNLGDFGFYPTTKLSDVLNSKNYKELVRNYKNHYICKNCLMRKPL